MKALLDGNAWGLVIAIWGLAFVAIGCVLLQHEFGAEHVAFQSALAVDSSAEAGDVNSSTDVGDPTVPTPESLVAESRISGREIEVDRVVERAVPDRGLPATGAHEPGTLTPVDSTTRILNAQAERAETAPPANVQNAPAVPAVAPMPAACRGDFGTALTFARNPAQACKLAKQDKKLVFFLHVSGNFEDSGFT